MKHLFPLILFAMCIGGCTGSGESRTSELVNYHMRLADSLEQEMAYQPAAEHYSVVATEFPQSIAYPTAVRRAAFLYASEFNPARNDSLALRWFTACLRLPLKRSERENIQTFVDLLQRIQSLRTDLRRRTASADSLSGVLRRHTSTATIDARRIQELETELQQVQTELKRMKEIDVRLSKSRK
jgi:hypothetical protein